MTTVRKNGKTYRYPEVREHDIQKQILDWLKLKRIFHFRNNVGAQKIGQRFIRFGVVGSPDIICVVDGRFIGIECKRNGGDLSTAQVIFSHELMKAGGVYIVARSLEDVSVRLEIIKTSSQNGRCAPPRAI